MGRQSITLAACLAVLFWAGSASAQVAFETSLAPSTEAFDSAGGTVTEAFDAGTGSNRVLLVFVCWRDLGNDVTGITYNSVSMTAAGAKVTSGSLHVAGRLFYLAGPASGSNTIEVTYSSGSGNFPAQIAAWVGNTVDQTTPISGYAFDADFVTGVNVQSSVTVSSQTGSRVVVFHATRNISSNLTATPTNYTERQDAATGTGFSTEFGDADGAASVATTATWSNASSLDIAWVAVGVSVDEAGGGGGGAEPCTRGLLGVGCEL